MTKTFIEKVASPSREIAIFKVGGTLGYHENDTLKKFFKECKKRSIEKVILDFSLLTSLGGGCARIIREATVNEEAIVSVAGASTTVKKFLKGKQEEGDIIFTSTVEEAIDKLGGTSTAHAGDKFDESEDLTGSKAERDTPLDSEHIPSCEESNLTAAGRGKRIENDRDGDDAARNEDPELEALASEELADDEIPKVIILGPAIDDSGEMPAFDPSETLEDEPPPKNDSFLVFAENPAVARAFKKKLYQYHTLFQINLDFDIIGNRSGVLDAFLLTVIAQIGIESAAFCVKEGDAFTPTAWRGLDIAIDEFPRIKLSKENLMSWLEEEEILEIEQVPFAQKLKIQLSDYEFKYAVPFLLRENIEGIVLLGKPLKKKLDPSWQEFTKMLMQQMAIAYENARRIEMESRRTLGLVHTLISLIEENTLARGDTDLVANYVYTLAKKLHYPKEYMTDLMFGTVLRDIGMIKVSDLILRSPRELVKEEWDIIKRHPSDGCEMIRSMGFSEHAIDVVKRHHERFNGEGYPDGLEGHSIPLGARIVSVVEAFTTMLRDRPNRPALTAEEALTTLIENWGMRYDPEIVEQFIEIIREEIRTGKDTRYNYDELFNL